MAASQASVRGRLERSARPRSARRAAPHRAAPPPTRRPPPQVRITSQHLQTGQYQGQQVRAVGKLVGMEGDRVQLQLAGEGAPAPRGKLARHVAPRRPCTRRAHPLFPRRPASARAPSPAP